jgi:hypothetical protein
MIFIYRRTSEEASTMFEIWQYSWNSFFKILIVDFSENPVTRVQRGKERQKNLQVKE